MECEPEREEEQEEQADDFPAKTARLKSPRSHFTLSALPRISAYTAVVTHMATTAYIIFCKSIQTDIHWS